MSGWFVSAGRQPLEQVWVDIAFDRPPVEVQTTSGFLIASGFRIDKGAYRRTSSLAVTRLSCIASASSLLGRVPGASGGRYRPRTSTLRAHCSSSLTLPGHA